ncbi:AHH domain-containing protein [Streptomyces sp. NPDC087901]|uniref:AHH domain-containing protein n=1 Tax=Streptomyces sp. NPDC087901 TaxID=3365818 RepID=UPI003814C7E8
MGSAVNTPVEATPGTAVETAVRGVAYRRLHLPTSVAFTGEDERPSYEGLLESLLLRAVADAIDKDDEGAGISSPRTGWPPAGDGAAAGTPVEPTPGSSGHLTFAMAVADTDDGEGEGPGEHEGDKKEGRGGAGQGAGAAGRGEKRGDGTEETAAHVGAPAADAQETSDTAATTDTDDTETGTPTTDTAAQAPPLPGAAAPTATVGTETTPAATPASDGSDESSEAAGTGAEQDPGVTVVTDPQSDVIQGPSPVDGRAVMVIGASQLVMLGEATRHARSSSLIHAVQLGDRLFGARSFAVLEGPLGTSGSFYWAVATAPTVTDEIIGKEVASWELEGQRISTFTGFHVLPVVTTLDGHRYGVNLLWTKERGWVWGSAEEGRRWIQISKSPQEYWLSAKELKVLTFQELDRLVDAGLAGSDESLEKAAAQLGEMNAKAFALVDAETREKYLEILVKAWTFEEQRHAIIQIMISLEGLTQLQAVRDRLIRAGLYEQLFADMGSELWELLTEVGKKFGGHKSLTVREFIGLVAEALNLTMHHDTGLSRNVEQEQTAVVDLKMMIEFEEAIRAAMGFVLGTLDSFKIMLTQPEKILSGLWELHKLTVTCYLASYGHAKSTRELQVLIQKVGATLVDGLRGAALFGVGPRAATRIKWAVIIEALTWISEIQAAVEALVKIEKIVAILRFLKMLKVFEGEKIAARFTRLAEAMHAGSAVLNGLKDEHAVAELLIMLPEEDGARLGAVLQEVEVPKGSSLAALMEHPRLGPVLTDIRGKAEVLRVFGAKSGGLTPELAHAFGRLTGKDGFAIAEVHRMAEALQEGEGARFIKMLEQIGFGRIGAQAEVKADLLAMLAGDSRRMDAVHQYGITVVGQMHARSAGGAEAFDAMIARLEKIRAKDVADGKAVEFSELLDKLRQGKKGAWRRVDRPLKLPPVKATVAERAPVLQRIKELRKRFPKNKVKNPKAMGNALQQIARMSETDPAKAMEHLEKFEDLLKAEHTTEGHVADIFAEAETKASREAKALHHEPGEAPAEQLGARDKLKSKTGEAGSESHELTESMEAIGQHKAYGEDAHHIAPASDRRAEPVRDILEWAGVNPDDDPLNGIYLPKTSTDPKIIAQAGTRHQVLHTDNYYKEITRRLVEARKQSGEAGVIHEMSRIKEDLIHGWHPPPATGAGHENFAQWFEGYKHNLEWLTDAEQLELLEKVKAPPRRKRAPRALRKASPKTTGPGPAPKPQPPAKAKAKPKAEVKPAAEAKPTAEVKPASEQKPKAEAKGLSEVKPAPETKPKADAKPKAEPKGKPKPKAKSEATPKRKTKPKTKGTRPEVKPEAKPEAKPEVKPEVKPEAKPEVKPESATTAETATEHLPEAEVHKRVATEAQPAESSVDAPRIRVEPEPCIRVGTEPRIRVEPEPRIRVEPEPRIRVEPEPRTRVDVGTEDVLGEPLYDVVDDPPKPTRKKKRANKQGGRRDDQGK